MKSSFREWWKAASSDSARSSEVGVAMEVVAWRAWLAATTRAVAISDDFIGTEDLSAAIRD